MGTSPHGLGTPAGPYSFTTPQHVTFQEVSAVKDYPGGFSLLRLHTAGYALNPYPPRDTAVRAFGGARPPGGLWAHYALGPSVTDRNSVAAHDLSGVTRPTPRDPVPGRLTAA
ncbi:hypothetical protein AB0O67_23220 [Streptomyces sp. NPDC086077]|uniref:hypothetical protein n=1 Tax=Streptomyces sp. NPDC086077 TaxID=3154862 RepID=UPI003445AA33